MKRAKYISYYYCRDIWGKEYLHLVRLYDDSGILVNSSQLKMYFVG
jgi:hypothetical protein